MRIQFVILNLIAFSFIGTSLAKNSASSAREASTAKTRPIALPPNQEELIASCNKDTENLPTDYFISHRAYSLNYNFKHRVPNWVYYRLSRENLKNSCAKRKDAFKADPILLKANLPAVSEKDYQGNITGYDRGHMAPSADFLWDKTINKETFFMTNMSPQTANLNQRAWNNLEDRIRTWACGHGELRVYTGPVLKLQKDQEPLRKLSSCVSVPEYFYKVIVSFKDGKYKGIGFIYSQSDDGDPYRQKATSIREVEKITGQDFFTDEFAPAVQDSFEKEFNWSDWDGTEQDCKSCPDNT